MASAKPSSFSLDVRSPCLQDDTSPFLNRTQAHDGSVSFTYRRGADHTDCQRPAQARAFKREVILLYSSSNDDAVAAVLHFVFRLRELGLDHWLVLMDTPAGCSRLVQLIPDAGCVYMTMHAFHKEWIGSVGDWFKRTLETHSASEYVQPWWEDMKRWTGHSRWPLMTRIAQLGYNLLMTDGDVYFAADPYVALKHSSLARHTMVIQAENFHSPGANTGGLYIQNYDPRGLVPWTLSQVPYRSLRWVESRFRNPLAPCAKVDIFEQGIFNDALCSSISGELIFMWSLVFASSLYGCTGPQGRDGNTVLTRSYRKCARVVEDRPTRRPWVATDIKGSQEVEAAKHVKVPDEYKLMFAPLRYPTMPAWPSSLPFYPPAEGPATTWWRAWLNSEGLSMLDEAASALTHTTNETVVIAPRWFMSRWHEAARFQSGGSAGWWNVAVQPPRSFVQHMVMLTWPAYPVRKLAMQFLGWWRYEVDKLLREPSYMRACSAFRFLSLAPGLAQKASISSMLPSWTSMMFLALLSQRQLVWPLQSCSDRIIDHSPHCFDGVCNMRVFTRGANQSRQCQPAQIGYGKGPHNLWGACSDYGVNTPQFEHLLAFSSPGEAAPSRANTAWFEDYLALLKNTAPNSSARNKVDHLSSLAEFEDAVSQLGRGGPVLWIGKPVAMSASAVHALTGEHKRMWAEAQSRLRCAYSVQAPARAGAALSARGTLATKRHARFRDAVATP